MQYCSIYYCKKSAYKWTHYSSNAHWSKINCISFFLLFNFGSQLECVIYSNLPFTMSKWSFGNWVEKSSPKGICNCFLLTHFLSQLVLSPVSLLSSDSLFNYISVNWILVTPLFLLSYNDKAPHSTSTTPHK